MRGVCRFSHASFLSPKLFGNSSTYAIYRNPSLSRIFHRCITSNMSDSERIPKRIIIFCDGTWQSAVSGEKNSPSNVTRLARSLSRVAVDANGKKWQQVAYYDSGIGTTSGWLGKKLEGATGVGIEGNIVEAYNFVVLNWAPGDQVLCFGFSRGAYTARSIAGLISDVGICEPRQLNDFHEIWKLYKEGAKGVRFHGSDAWFDYIDGVADPKQPLEPSAYKPKINWISPPHGDWAQTPESREIEVVGVYDTVGSLGMPSVKGVTLGFGPDKTGFHNVKLNPNVKRAFQALAIDEHREAFAPTLWHLPKELNEDGTPKDKVTSAKIQAQEKKVDDAHAQWIAVAYDSNTPVAKRKALKSQYNEARRILYRLQEDQKQPSELLQVWFPGVHINVGGGSSDTLENKGDLEEMSTITYAWMLDQITPYVAVHEQVFHQEAVQRQQQINKLNDALKTPPVEEKREASSQSWGQWAWGAVSSATQSVKETFTGAEPATPERHDFGWGTGTIIDSYTLMYHANGSVARTPGAYEKDPKVPAPGPTNEMIHPTVGFRMAMTETLKDEKLRYQPAGLKNGKVVRQKNAAGKWEYIINGGAPIPEFVMKPSGGNSFERFAVSVADMEKTKPYIDRLDALNYPGQQS